MGVVSLRRRLLLLIAVAILPLALMSGVALQALLQQQRQQIEQSTLDLARALGTAVDNELRLTITALQTIASNEPFSAGLAPPSADLARLAARVLAARPEWLGLILAEPSGRVIFNSGFSDAALPPAITEQESLAAVVRTRAPAVGSLARGARGRWGVAVRVPIVVDGELRHVLTAVLRPESLLEVIARQRVPADWIVSVFDANHIRVLRSRDHARFIGGAATASLLPLLQQGAAESVGLATTLEGERVITAVSRLPSTGWTAVLGVPRSAPESALSESALAYGGGLLLSLLIGSLAAFLVARSIARPIARLRESAELLGNEPGPERQAATGLAEIDAVADALLQSARLRERVEAERESLLAAERRARAAAEKAQRRLELVAGAGALLARSLEEQTTLEAIASVVVPDIADVCRIDLLDENGVLQRKLTYHRDPAQGRAIAQMVERGTVSPQTRGSFPWAIATGQTFLANFDSPEAFELEDPTYREFAQLTGMRGLCVMPLVAGGRTLGAFAALQTDSGRLLTVDDGLLLAELAHRAALALDNVRLYAESKAALGEAEVANRAKDEFLAMLGHELRNPLAPIVTSLELMARRDPHAAPQERRVIERQVAHLSRLVDDLLDVSRIASGKIHLSPERVDLRAIVGRALELAAPALQQRTRPPEVSLPDEPVWVHGDAMRLSQVVSNLLGNAAKFTARGQRIAIALESTRDHARIVVSDEGVGIAPELLPQIFERFVQGEQALERAAGGLGLGLAIARNLVDLHGGTIEATSDGPGRGSRFVVVLPLEAAPGEAALPAAAPTSDARQGARILLVDDNLDAAESLQQVLALEGHEVLTAGSAEEALAALGGFRPQIALLDIGLPKMNGYELARLLRADPRLPGLKLIALTGYGRGPDRRLAFDAGFDEHMVKPVDIDSLLARVDVLRDGSSPVPA